MKKKVIIPDDFIIGAASSAWQTEGWSGKRESQDSYMDLWYKEERNVWHNGFGPAGATDLYNKYEEDARLMKEIGLSHYRTSINWSRFLVDYENAIVDETYAQYIDNFLDKIIEAGTVPMLCLEHYELPAELFTKYGGWGSKHVVELFVKYAEKALERFGDKVKYWFVFNEPIVVQTRVYLDAIRYPHVQDTKVWMQWNYNKVLATAKVVELYKLKGYQGQIGTVLNPEYTYPRSSAQHDLDAARIYDLFYNRVFMDPNIKGTFPCELMELNEKHGISFEWTEEEMDTIKNNTIDYLGINIYYPHRVKAPSHKWNDTTPFHPAYYYDLFELPGRKMNVHRGWEIYPEVVYDVGMLIKEEYGNIPWILSENGMGVENEGRFRDDSGMIQDTYRIDFISEHLGQLIRAKEDGSNCLGYMLWAFTDNVSPMNAFKNRYGLVEIDLDKDRERRMKQSALWYKQIIHEGIFEVEDENEYK